MADNLLAGQQAPCYSSAILARENQAKTGTKPNAVDGTRTEIRLRILSEEQHHIRTDRVDRAEPRAKDSGAGESDRPLGGG